MQGHGPSSQRSAGKGLLNEHRTKDSAVPSSQDESKRKAIPQQAIWLWCRGYAHLKIQPSYRYPHHRVQNLLTPPRFLCSTRKTKSHPICPHPTEPLLPRCSCCILALPGCLWDSGSANICSGPAQRGCSYPQPSQAGTGHSGAVCAGFREATH